MVYIEPKEPVWNAYLVRLSDDVAIRAIAKDLNGYQADAECAEALRETDREKFRPEAEIRGTEKDGKYGNDVKETEAEYNAWKHVK